MAEIFEADGEDAGASPWEFTTIQEYFGGSFALDAGAKRQGSYGYRYESGGGIMAVGYGQKAFAEQADMILEFYLRIDSGFNWSASGEYLDILRLYDSLTDLGDFGIYGSGSSVPNRWRTKYRGGSIQYSTLNFSLGAWHKIEFKWTKHASAGGYELVVDGDSALSDLDNNTDSWGPNDIYLGGWDNSGVIPSGEGIDLDDILAYYEEETGGSFRERARRYLFTGGPN